MFRLFALLSLLASAFSFSPRQGFSRSSIALQAKSKSVPFLEAPQKLDGMIGDKGFDPVGFSDYIDPRYLREAEIKVKILLVPVKKIVTMYSKNSSRPLIFTRILKSRLYLFIV